MEASNLGVSHRCVSEPLLARQMSRLPYPGGVTSECGDTGSKMPLSPTSPRRFGQLPDLAVRDDFDDPLPETELDTWEGRASEEG